MVVLCRESERSNLSQKIHQSSYLSYFEATKVCFGLCKYVWPVSSHQVLKDYYFSWKCVANLEIFGPYTKMVFEILR